MKTTKAEALRRWSQLEPADPLRVMAPTPYKAAGSKYGTDSIRIGGSPEFIDAVMSNLKTIIDGENHVTRLTLSRAEVKSTEINGERRVFANASAGAEIVYIALNMRGSEGAIASGVFSRDLDGATERFAEVNRYAS
ncbi:hypothetical protein LCGC14_2074200 [marine sediment metagenome]|uniref:Uncharacterized protein n=1 Tax=marine sediment metagenome TaxID=412755 RepID=A0A0F9EHC9_9ZZZZ